MTKTNIQRLTLSAMFIAVGVVLPFLTGQIPQIGNMLLPMHIPVLLCGLICGWKYGLAIGFVLPLLRSFLFSMPPLYPIAIAMAFELSAYGFIVGFMYERLRKKNIFTLYLSLITAMLGGRIVWGIAQFVLLGVRGNMFTLEAFMAGAILNAIPGILLQLIIIPAIIILIRKKTAVFRP